MSQTFVLFDDDTRILAGFYSLSASVVEPGTIPPGIAKKYSQHFPIPALLIARLARHINYRGQQVGELLLVNALKRCVKVSSDVGVGMIIVDAKNEWTSTFYQRYGFTRFPDSNRLWLGMRDARRSFSG